MTRTTPMLYAALALLVFTFTPRARAQDLHGPRAPITAFPSHVFQVRPHAPETPQLSFHAGLLQPFLHGFNMALDVRYRRLVASYSHGVHLDYGSRASGLEADERRAKLGLVSPWTTGGGLGVILLDELYLMADFKVHRYEAELGADQTRYTTVSVGAELGYRLFVWRGIYLNPMLRYWPNVWTSLPGGAVTLRDGERELRHHAKDLGLFANVSIGIAFYP